MTSRPKRSWGYWSQAKLQILERYLDAFLSASSRVNERVYIDAFAGEGTGVDRLTGQEFSGSARIALDAVGAKGAQFTRLIYFERAQLAGQLESELHSAYPGRQIRVYGGDCNITLPMALEDISAYRWAPTFAFVDPNGLEFEWSTLKALADHKRGYRRTPGKPENKVEIWLLFPTQGLIRTLALADAKFHAHDAERASRLYGNDDWQRIYDARRGGLLTPAEAKEEYVNLMRWRLTTDLGYGWAHSLELKNLAGGTLYHMIFATDNEAGNRIISDLYAKAAREIPQMRQEAIDEQHGQLTLDVAADLTATGPPYEYEPPWDPTDEGRS